MIFTFHPDGTTTAEPAPMDDFDLDLIDADEPRIDTRGMHVEHLGGGTEAFVKYLDDGMVEVISDGNLGTDVDNPALEPVRLLFASRSDWENSGEPIELEYLGSPHRHGLGYSNA